MTRRRPLLAAIVLALAAIGSGRGPLAAGAASLPDRLTDEQFWELSARLSEPRGVFQSDNLVSNELVAQAVIPELATASRVNRVYLGVGPEQNFTYIVALRPRLAFIVDIRRENLQLHLMYKALFALSEDRVEFVSRLFSRKRPPGLSRGSSANAIFEAVHRSDTAPETARRRLRDVQDHLTRTRRFPLTADDLTGIEYVHASFSLYGPGLSYWSTSGRGPRGPTYWDLMVADDGRGVERSYLATEEHFRFMKELHARNLIVPVVGNFAGLKALRGVGAYLRAHNATVAAFYLSNVEQYLQRQGAWGTFCGNVAALPLDGASLFIRSIRTGYADPGMVLDSVLGSIAAEVKGCAPN